MKHQSAKDQEPQKPKWDWKHIQCNLKTVEGNRKTVIWNLIPRVILTNPANHEIEPIVRLYVDTQKSLQYSNQLGWNWHKSWNIPNISLRLEIKDQTTDNILTPPPHLYAQIFAVKANYQHGKPQKMTLTDVGMRGVSQMEMVNGQVYFSGNKFSSTTYNNQGVNFHLLMVVYIQNEKQGKPNILTAVMSPSIFVDSRRSARDYQSKKFNSFVEPFAHCALQKEFTKRQNNSRGERQTTIKNSPEGFYNYITAPNIRHKVKHLIFLAIKFSNCVRIYYNTKILSLTNINKLLENLQIRLLKESKGRQKVEGFSSPNLNQKHFVLAVNNLNDSLKCKKIIEAIEIIQNDQIGITCEEESLKQHFHLIGNENQLRQGYKQSFRFLRSICDKYEPRDQSESSDIQDSEFLSKDIIPSKKLSNQPRSHKLNAPNKKISISINNQIKQSKYPVQQVVKSNEIIDSEEYNPGKSHNNKITLSASNKNPIAPLLENQISSCRHGQSKHEQNPAQITLPAQQIKSEYDFKDINHIQHEIPKSHHGSGKQQTKNVLNYQQNSNIYQATLKQPQCEPRVTNPIIQSPLQNLISKDIHRAFQNEAHYVQINNNRPINRLDTYDSPNNILNRNDINRYNQVEQQILLNISRPQLDSKEQLSAFNLAQQLEHYRQLLAKFYAENQQLKRELALKQKNQLYKPINSHQNVNYFGSMNYCTPGSDLYGFPERNYFPNMYNSYGPTRTNHIWPQTMPHNMNSMPFSNSPVNGDHLARQRLCQTYVKDQAQQNIQKNFINMNANLFVKTENRGLPSNYQVIKGMIIEEIKRQAKLRDQFKGSI